MGLSLLVWEGDAVVCRNFENTGPISSCRQNEGVWMRSVKLYRRPAQGFQAGRHGGALPSRDELPEGEPDPSI